MYTLSTTELFQAADELGLHDEAKALAAAQVKLAEAIATKLNIVVVPRSHPEDLDGYEAFHSSSPEQPLPHELLGFDNAEEWE